MLNPLFNIRIADVLDILFVATMFYTASVWLKPVSYTHLTLPTIYSV